MPPTELLKWVDINDFRPGIQSATNNTEDAQSHAPLGSATKYTKGCIATSSGALVPLPKKVEQYNPTPPDNFVNVLDNRYYISGFHVTGPITGAAVASGAQQELHIAWEWYKTAGAPNPHREYRWERHERFANPVVIDTLKSITAGGAATLGAVRGTFFQDIRMDPSVATNPGRPLVAAAWYDEGGGADKFVAVYPNPSAPTTNALLSISSTLPCDIICAHQGRLVMFEQRGWSHGSPGSWISNEQIWYTIANLPTMDNTTADTFSSDHMTGIGVAKTVSASELLIVKFQEGGFAVSGDLSNPTVMTLPGVMPTYGATTIPVYSKVGLIYGVLGGGVYAWGGGDSSRNIAEALEDGFWQHPFSSPFVNYDGKFAIWRDWIACPNSYLFDTNTGGWWRLDGGGEGNESNYFHYGVDYTGNLFAVPTSINANTDEIVAIFQYGVPADSYFWESNYLTDFGLPGRQTEVREVVIEAMGHGTIQVDLFGGETTENRFSSLTFTIDSIGYPTIFRQVCSIKTTGNLFVDLTVTGTDGNHAPMVVSVKLGYRDNSYIEPGVGA